MNHGGHGAHGEIKDCDAEIIESVLSAATRVHQAFGPGLLESVYEMALAIELTEAGIRVQRQVEIPVTYRGKALGVGFRADMIVAESLLLEIKAVEDFNAVHLAQLMTYLKLLQFKRRFLLNFNCRLMKQGIKRVSI